MSTMDISSSSSADDGNHNRHVQQQWTIGQIVDVQPRTWAGINRQGGTGKITALHGNGTLDVKYILCGSCDKNLQPHLVSPHQDLQRTTRRRPEVVPPDNDGGNNNNNNLRPPPRVATAAATSRRMSKPKLPKKKKQQQHTSHKTKHQQKTSKRGPTHAASVHSTPADWSSAASSASITVSYYIPKEIAVPLVLSDIVTTQDTHPPIFSPLTCADAKKSTALKAPSPTSSSSSSSGPPSVIEECYMSDDENEPLSTLERTMTTTESASTAGPTSAMAVDHLNQSPNIAFDGNQPAYPTHNNNNKLRLVYEDERRNATRFIDSVVETNQELHRFSSMLNQALLQHDGALDVTDIRRCLDGTYSEDQIQHHLQQLCAQNKIMRTDNVIYSM